MELTAKQQYDRARYRKRRAKELGERKCLSCDILLRSKYGAYNSRAYCRSCIDSGAATKDQNRRYYRKNRRRLIKKATAYIETHKEERKAYMKAYGRKIKLKRHVNASKQTTKESIGEIA